MGTAPDSLGILSRREKALTLVKKITDKTKDRKILWIQSQDGFRASVSPGMQLAFIQRPVLLPPPPALAEKPWRLFVVRDREGRDVLRVENEPSILGLLAGVKDVLQEAVEGLYATVLHRGTEDIDKAIDIIDKT